MACNICGEQNGCCCATGVFTLPHVGWACPVCHKSNAPGVKTCDHCAKHEVRVVVVVSDTSMKGKIYHVGADNMTRQDGF